jgi:hypothetical protein
MPSKIRIGCVVSGATGELYQPDVDDEAPRVGEGAEAAMAVTDLQKKQRRRRRRRREGTIIESVGPNRWKVLWADTLERLDHPSNVLRFVSEGSNIRRGTMPPQCSTTGTGVFADPLPTPVSVNATVPQYTVPTHIAGQHTPPVVDALPAMATPVGAPPAMATPVGVLPIRDTTEEPATTEAPAIDGEDIDDTDWEENLLIPTQDGLGRREDEDDDVPDMIDLDQMNPCDFEFENADDRFSNEELLFEYDDDLAAEMEKGREMVDKMINATNEKRALMGTVVSKGNGLLAIDWTVREDVTESEVPDKKEYRKVGIRGFKFGGEEDDRGNSSDSSSSDDEFENMQRSLKSRKRKKSKKQKAKQKKVKRDQMMAGGKRMHLFPLLRHLWPGNWTSHLAKMNAAIVKENDERVSCLTLYSISIVIFLSCSMLTFNVPLARGSSSFSITI